VSVRRLLIVLLVAPLLAAGAVTEEPMPMGEEEPVAVAPPRGAVRTVPERWTIPPAVIASLREARDRPVGVRMEVASRTFLGLPYTNEAAGEGEGEDLDPPSRYDTFDCLTFVEEVTSLALAGDPLYAPAVRDAFRYRGAPSYADRRHFMEAQWVPDAIRNGLLDDITAKVGRASYLRKDVTLDTWRHWRHRAFFALPDLALPTGEWTLPYLDLDAAAESVPVIPPGAILLTLRQPRAWAPVVTTHISMVVPTADGVRMRHATRMGARKVRDDRLDWYVTHLRDYVNWPALGITVLFPREQGPRRSIVVETPPAG
jgi:hypothetical protein